MTSMRMRLVSSISFVASYVCRISWWFQQCFVRLAIFCTCQLRLILVFQLCAGVGGVGGDDVHANAACVFCFSCCFLCVSHFISVFTVICPTLDFLHMPA